MADQELKHKLQHLLEHWMEHNDGHAAEYDKWATQAREAGFIEAAERINAGARVVREANKSLQQAMNALS